MPVEQWDETRDGPLSEAAMRMKLEQRGYRVTCYICPPGTFFPEHSHRIDKDDAVLSGRFRVRVEGHQVILEEGDCPSVPRGTMHSAEVVGNVPVVSLVAAKD